MLFLEIDLKPRQSSKIGCLVLKSLVSSVPSRYEIYSFIRSSRSRCRKSPISSIFQLSLNLPVCVTTALVHLTLSRLFSTLVMDSFYLDQSTGDSHQSRSRSNSHLSAAASWLQDLKIGSTVRSSEARGGSPSKVPPTSTLSFLDPVSHQVHQTSSSFISSPVPQQYTPFPLLSESNFDSNWPYRSSGEGQIRSAPVVRLDPFCSSPQDLEEQSVDNRVSSSRSDSISAANMR